MFQKNEIKNVVAIIIFFTIITIFASKSYAKYVFEYTKKAIDIEIISANLITEKEN